MRLKTAIITLITIFTSSILLANTLSLGDNGDGTWNVYYSSDGEIGGFQFNVDGATINGASGGAAGDAGFMVSTSTTTVLGFSLSGATLPDGYGVLTVLSLSGTPEGLSGIVVSNAGGQEMGFSYDDGGGGGGNITDGCDLPTNNVLLTSDGDILFNTDTPIAGFQMNVDGADISNAGGGAAGAAGFMISASGNTVLGFSLSGATIEGCGTLVELELNGNATGLSGIIISDASGQSIAFEYYSGGNSDVEGCMDMDACNYNPDATVDSGCEYAMENYDCDGNCTAVIDCAGECGGNAMEDECGECNGSGADVECWDGSMVCDAADCSDEPSGTVEIMYDSSDPIGGFQFNITGVSITDASGGAAGDAGFMISSSESTVLGFSLTGETIPAGSGVLVVLEVDGDDSAACLENVILSDSDGVAMDSNVEGCVSIVVGGSGGGDWDGDACSMPGGSVHLTAAGDILFNTGTPLAGFQMNVDGGATISSAGGGEAEAAGFMISASGNTILGFSLTGATIDGCGTLVELELDGSATGLSGIIISDSDGQALPFEYFDGSGGGGEDVYGCMDMDACNYNPDATVDSGCEYAEENYDCDGNCTAELDCADECGGDAVVDECGECGGGGADVMCEDGSYVCDESDCDTGGGWDGDACTMSDHSVHVTSSGSVLFNSSTPVAGFQMDLDGATIISAGGGMADEAGFMISSSATTFLGFSLDGSTIEGCGTMVELELDGSATGLSGIIISDSNGELIPFEYFEGGPMDPYCGDGECNGDEDADSCPEDCDTGGGWDGDACSMPDHTVHVTSSGLVLFNSSTPVAGFQMDLDGATIISAGGGMADEAGFMISSSATTFLGFSLDGSTIEGCGTMVELELDGEASGLSGIIISDSNGELIPFEYFDGSGGGEDPYCGDGECNGDEDAASCPEDCEAPGECETDVCLSYSNFDEAAGTVDLHMVNAVDVAGFQVELEGSTISDAAGGFAEAAGFMISNSETMVLGFSVTGDVISPSTGNLITLTFDSYNGYACFSENTTFSDSNADALSLTLGSCLGEEPVPGCTDSSACNYDPNANVDNGTCWEASVGCECADGEGSVVDECGVCNGDGIPTGECDCEGNIEDCAGVCGGDAELDACGVCEGDGSSCDPVSLSFSNVTSNSLDVVMDNPMPVAGFQMELPGININSISGGTSGTADFSISFSGSTLVGFTMSGDDIPVGNAVLFSVGFTADGDEVCFQNAIVSDENGVGADLSLGDCASLEDDDCEEAWDSDPCTMADNSVHVAADGSVLYNTLEPVAGFQFSIEGAAILNASGGAAEDAGFMISFSETTVLGFSLDGSTFDGCGTMISLELDGSASGMSELIISNADGEDIGFTYFEGGGDGEPCCGDGECNGDETSDSCPEDCGDPEPYCGDGECNGDETAESCPEDCDDGGDCEEAWDGDPCSMPDHSLHLDAGGSILFNSSTPLAGFQIDVDGATITNAEGGEADAAGFMIQASDNTVLGFSLDGSTISGCGTMIELTLDGDATGLSGIIMADAGGEEVAFTYFEGGGDGEPCCGDGECNGDETSESCPEDCEEDECPEGYDECGVCDGPGAEYECWDGELVCEASDCSNEPGTDPFNFNQSTMFAYYFVFSAYDCPGDYLVAGEDWIGVYNGDVCVGGAEWPGGPTEVPAFGNDGNEYSEGYLNPGDTPTFKIYDASEDKYYDAMPNENFAFQPYGVNNIIRMDAGLFQNVMLDEGANLVSFYVLPEDNSVEDMMDPLMGNVSAVLSGGAAAQYLDGWGWIGSLTTFEYEAGYWIIMDASAELNLEGCDSPTANLVYDLQAGANLISYPEEGSSDVSAAIPDDVESLFEAVLSQGNAAMNTENGWVGSLTSFSGGSGYWVIVSEDLTFSYNLNDGFGRAIEDYSETMPTFGEFKVNQSTEQAFYFVDEITLLDGIVDHGDWLLSYNDNVLTGIRQWQGVMVDIPAMGTSDATLNSGYFVEGDVPTFKLLKQTTGDLISLDGEIAEWSSNGVFTLNGLSEIESAPGKISLDSAYPNPFNPTTTISFGLPVDSKVSIQIYNLQGRVVETLASQFMQAGYHSVTWNADNFSSGVYFVKMATGDYVSTQKLLLVK